MLRIWLISILFVVGLTGCCREKPQKDVTAAWDAIENASQVEVVEFGATPGPEGEHLGTLTPMDPRFIALKEMILASKGHPHYCPKAPYSNSMRLVFTDAHENQSVVLVKLDSIDVDGAFFIFDKYLELYRLF